MTIKMDLEPQQTKTQQTLLILCELYMGWAIHLEKNWPSQ